METISITAVPAVELHVNGSSFLADEGTALDLARDIINSLGYDILASDIELRDTINAIFVQHNNNVGPWTTNQRGKLFGLYNELFDGKDREARLAFADDVLGRMLDSWSELSFEDASRVIDALTAIKRDRARRPSRSQRNVGRDLTQSSCILCGASGTIHVIDNNQLYWGESYCDAHSHKNVEGPSEAEQAVIDAAKAWDRAYASGKYDAGAFGARERLAIHDAVEGLGR